MALSGYLHDLIQLMDDCLLSNTDKDTALIDCSLPDPNSQCHLNLTDNTFATMTLLDTPSVGQDEQIVDRARDAIALSHQSYSLPHTSTPRPLSLSVPLILPPPLAPALQASSPSTALAIRATADVIADLKGSQVSRSVPARRKEDGPTTTSAAEMMSVRLTQKEHVSHGTGVEEYLDSAEEDENEQRIAEEEELAQQEAKPRQISERKRVMNAIADSYIHLRMRNSIKESSLTGPEDAENKSTRWIINQSENRQIISSPRDYQVELFERAKLKNIIAVLDTGSGKTLIAVLLIRHICAQELEDRELGKSRRISFFLVDSVTLVFQQHAVLKANLDQETAMFCGDMGCDLWSRDLWMKHFAKNEVIVCTAEVLNQCLHHSFISMNQINLLIFDEAHHAKKNHSYARIMKDYYAETEKAARPKVFGMTASPADARVDVRAAAAELEGLLHCEIATAPDTSLMQYSVRSHVEQLAKYAPLGPMFNTALYTEMHGRFKANAVFRKPLLYARKATRELGAWCADQVWPFCLSDDETKRLQAATERHYHTRKITGPIETLEKNKAQIEEAKDMVKSYKFDPPDYVPSSTKSSNLSSKVVLLIRYLKERFERPTNDKCIVFVNQRYTARLLATLFSQPDIGTPYLHVGTLVGTGTGNPGDLTFSFREQVVTMMNFRKGAVNCLFATSVAEEGLDIPDCNLVIRFDLYTTLIQYIQSRGRARHVNSRYIHMSEDRNQEHIQIIREVRQNEDVLRRFCSALPDDRKLTGNDFDMESILAREKSHRVYKVPETGAKLTYRLSIVVVANFVASLPRTSESSLGPEYVVTSQNNQFICEVILPEASPIRGAIGRPASTKQVAKCSAAFEICLLLRKGKYLNEWLIPIFTKQLPAMRNALLAVDSKKRESYDMRTKPSLWAGGEIPEELFMTVLLLVKPASLDRLSQPLGLLTRSRLPQLPSFVLHFGAGQNSPLQCIALAKSLKVNPSTLSLINTCTLCIFYDVFSKSYESDEARMPYFIVPITTQRVIDLNSSPADLIEWNILELIENGQLQSGDKPWETKSWDGQPDDYFNNKFIVDPWDGSRKLWSVGVSHEYRPLDPVPPNTAPRVGSKKNNSNIMEYSCSLWTKARSRRTFDINQPVIEANLISLRRNLLDELSDLESKAPKKCFVIIEPLRISLLPTTVVAMAYLFPAIMHRIESYLIALEACNLLHLDIRPDLALEALTKDSDNSDEHSDEQLSFQRGMGNNYERLEFLGDCFLKMATSISLYSKHPDNNEYRYHVDRMLLICNRNLRDNALKLKLYEYIRSASFNRRAWYPEGLVLKKGKAAMAPNSHKLGDKTIADVCEAVIGAALLTYHESKDMDNAVRAVTELVSSENHQVTAYIDYYKLYKMPKYQTDIPTAAQRDLASQVEKKDSYHFQYPRLLRCAFVHPSYPFLYERIPSYQRLEFLGDALLDMACVNFLFHNFPQRDPQWLTEHKMAMVSNQFLGALCVSLGFHRHLLVFSTNIQRQITDYVTEITEAKAHAEDDAVRAGKTSQECSPDFWVSVRHPPKCLADIIEAYIGAIFVDSQFKYAEVERFFDEHIKWYFTDMTIYDTYANRHPTTFLTKFLQVHMGCMNWTVLAREISTIDGSKPQVVAVVMIHNQIVADAEAESSRYAKVHAAKKAMAELEGLPLPEFRERFLCDCKHGEGNEELLVMDEQEIHGNAI